MPEPAPTPPPATAQPAAKRRPRDGHTRARILTRAWQLAITAAVVLSLADTIVAVLDVDARIEQMYQREAAIAEAQGATLAREDFAATPFTVTAANLTKWVAGAIALALVWLAGARPEVRMLALFLALNLYTDDALAQIGVAHPLLDALEAGSVYLAVAALLRFAALFPRPLARADLWAAWGRRRAAVAALLLDGRVVWGAAAVLVVLEALLPAPRSFMHQMAAFAFTMSVIIASVLLLRAGYALVDDAGRRRILWVVAAFVGMLVTGVLYLAAIIAFRITDPALSIVLAQIPEIVMLGALAAAIFYFGAIDPALVIRQATVYGALALLLVALFEGIENVASDVLASRFGMPGAVGSLLAGTLVAIAFVPLRQFARRGSERVLGRVLPVTTLSSAPREHAVILFSDLVGYTELSARDEQSALILAALFHRTARRVGERNGGRLVKTIGDAVLLEFGNARGASATARALQPTLRTNAATLDLGEPLLRTGLHAGNVARAPDGDIFGDAVNVASRLQSAAAPGEVLASRELVESAGGEADGWEFAGARTLRNVPAPVDTFRAVVLVHA